MNESEDRPPIPEAITEVKAKWTKHLETARAFYRTKLAIQRGLPLYEWSAADLETSKYLGPWKFNAIETAVTGGLASLTVNIASALGMNNPEEAVSFEGIDPAMESILKTTLGWLEPFTVPVVLTAFVHLMGWGTLRKRDSTSEKRRRARHAYLYFDGAYGLYSQLFLACGLGLISTKLGAKIVGSDSVSYYSIIFVVALVLCGIWQFLITARKIPRLLFVANGYTARARHFWQRSHPADPPWNKLVLVNLVGGWPLFLATSLLISALSFALAWLLFQVRELLV